MFSISPSPNLHKAAIGKRLSHKGVPHGDAHGGAHGGAAGGAAQLSPAMLQKQTHQLLSRKREKLKKLVFDLLGIKHTP